MVPAHLTPADQLASGEAEALRLPNIEEPANEVESGVVAPSAAGGHYGAAAGT